MAEKKEEWSGENHLCYVYVICKGEFIVKTFGVCFIVLSPPFTPTLPGPSSCGIIPVLSVRILLRFPEVWIQKGF